MGESESTGPRLTRRRVLGLGVAGALAAVAAACRQNATGADPDRARLKARPATPGQPAPPGLTVLGSDVAPDGLLYVPAGYRPDQPAPLVLMLHGAGGTPQGGINPFLSLADGAGLVLLAPASRLATWDIVYGFFGPDVAFIDEALAYTFDRCAIDPGRIAVAGFSDGASYSLSLGLTNGDLFGRAVAFSPGFMRLAARRGTPRVFVSHGTQDQVLPIDQTSRRLVPELERAGYDVEYREFDGGHAVPAEIAAGAAAWLAATWG